MSLDRDDGAGSTPERGDGWEEPGEDLNEVSGVVIASAIEVHSELGPGLLERVYQEALVTELEDRGVDVRTEVDLPVCTRASS